MFKDFLSYKMNWYGGDLILINPKNTSIKCSICSHVAKENRKSLIKFQCVKCKHTENADLNASKNILAEGHSVIACGVEVLVSTVKQELQTRKPAVV